MNVLIVAAHGSRKKESALDVACLCEKLGKKAQDRFDRVEYAFLQFATPLLEAKIEAVVKNGARQIIVFPLFIAVGSHVLADIPRIIETARTLYPHVSISITRHLGVADKIEDLILGEVTTHLNRQD